MRINLSLFNSHLKELFKNAGVNKNRLQLNGSFRSSYYASDIDLYEPVSKSDLGKVRELINGLNREYYLTEIKVVEGGDKVKVTNLRDFEGLDIDPKRLEMIKVDMVVYFLVFPIECTIIYDFDSKRKMEESEFIDNLLGDVSASEHRMFKKIKRLASVGALLGYPSMFSDITENTEMGLLYLSDQRLTLLRSIRSSLSDRAHDQFQGWIAEDLRKYGYKPSQSLRDILDAKIVKFLRKS